MSRVARFNSHIKLCALGGHIEEKPAMINLENISSEPANARRYDAEHAGVIRDGKTERNDPILTLKLAHHDGSEHARIDIAATQDKADFHSLEPCRLRQHRREAGGTRPFCHGFLKRQVGIDLAVELRLINQNDVGDQFAYDRQSELANIFHRNALGERRSAERPIFSTKRVPDRRIEHCFGANDFDCRIFRSRTNGVTSDKSAAANRKYQQIEIGHVFQHFERDRALPAEYALTIIRLKESESALPMNSLAAGLPSPNRLAMQNDLRAMQSRRCDFHKWGRHRHYDR